MAAREDSAVEARDAGPDDEGHHRAALDVEAEREQRGADLVRTAEAYFHAGSSPRHAATSLHVHVNTVAQRLHRIGELLGADWQEPRRALQVQLALHLRHLTG